MKRTGVSVFDHCLPVVFYIVFLLYALIPFHLYLTPVHTAAEIIYIVWTAVILVHDLVKGRLCREPAVIILTLFILWAFLSFVLQPKGHGIYPFIHLLETVMMVQVFFTACAFMSDEEADRFAVFIGRLVILPVVIMNLLSLFYHYGHETIAFSGRIISLFDSYMIRGGVLRYAGVYYHPVLAGEKCFAAVVFGLFLREKRKISLPLLVIILVSSGIMMKLADSRTAYLQMILAAAFYAGCRLAEDRRRFRLFSAAAVLTVILFAGIFLFKYGSTGLTFENLNRISSNRLLIWKTAYGEFLKRPVLGWGWNNGDAVARLNGPNVDDCHNIVFNLLLWTGLPGTLLFVTAGVIRVIRIIRYRHITLKGNCLWYTLITFGFFFQSLLDPLIVGEDIRLGTPLFWFFAGVVYYRMRDSREPAAAE